MTSLMFSKPVTNIISRSNPRPNPIIEPYGVLGVKYEKWQVSMEEEEEGMEEKRQLSMGVEEKREDEKEDEKETRQISVVEKEEQR
jgi:hypothetical protein